MILAIIFTPFSWSVLWNLHTSLMLNSTQLLKSENWNSEYWFGLLWQFEPQISPKLQWKVESGVFKLLWRVHNMNRINCSGEMICWKQRMSFALFCLSLIQFLKNFNEKWWIFKIRSFFQSIVTFPSYNKNRCFLSLGERFYISCNWQDQSCKL